MQVNALTNSSFGLLGLQLLLQSSGPWLGTPHDGLHVVLLQMKHLPLLKFFPPERAERKFSGSKVAAAAS